MESFIDKSGKKRDGIKVLCLRCGKEFSSRADQVGKYCSNKCYIASRTKKVEVKCASCNANVYKTPTQLKNSKSGLYFCSRRCKDNSQKLGGIEAIMPPHYGKSLSNRNSEYYRKQYKLLNNLEQLICERCSYCEFECGIDIHHIDNNSNNNDKNNLKALCSPCHRALHLGLIDLGS